MRIIELQAENLKRLKAVDITPEGDIVVISGKNGAGKTSVLDAIWFALGGAAAARETPMPIREGETDAKVTLDLGDLVVTRTWKDDDKTSLSVTSKEGAKFSSPQGMLDELVGRLSFDPLAFTTQTPREQRAALLDLIDLPFDPANLEAQRAGLYDRRTEIGRSQRANEGRLTGIHPIPADIPDEEVSPGEVLAALAAAQKKHDAIREAERAVTDADREVARLEQEAESLERQIAELTERQTVVYSNSAATRERVAAAREALATMPPPPPLNEFEEQLGALATVNAAVRSKKERAAVEAAVAADREAYEALTRDIDALDEMKTSAIAAAKLPIEGLAFDDDGVTFGGIPFAQCSAGERLRVSMAMAMAMNPKLRVIRITDGSLLDSDNMALIAEMAAAEDFQVWIERVDETGTVGVYIEDGEVKA